MDKNAIKKYAVWARRELISRVTQRALKYGISEKEIIPAKETSIHGVALSPTEIAQRTALISQINNKGFEQVMEEVAYTWFNRFSALRFMEVNGYLPTHVRVFTDDENNFKPQIMAEAINLEMDGLDMEKVYAMKDANDNDALFKYLIITQCNALSSILPGMFQKIDDYTELLFPDNLLREGSAIEQMISLIPEDDWKDQVQIIGWLYQYYNTEPKDRVFADLKKNIKISKENIPAATQLFTPDWIVRYMVENSLGRLWLEGHPNTADQLLPTKEEQEKYIAGDRNERDLKWHYYLEEAEQEPDVQVQLDEIRKEYASLKPEDIKCIDPCSGSGHILAYMFDVLVRIYETYGYTAREAAASIVENNLYGLDIDDRAAQLAYFSVMMKARQYDRRFFSRGIQPQVFAIKESNRIEKSALAEFVGDNDVLRSAMETIIAGLHDAKEYGSIISVSPVDFRVLYNRFDEIREGVFFFKEIILNDILPLVQVAEVLAQKYHTVVTNPPYMGAKKMNTKLVGFAKKFYPVTKSDLFAIFIERCNDFLRLNGYQAMITQHAWMFLDSFKDLREEILNNTIMNMAHLGTRAFEEIGGEVVQTTAFVMLKKFLNKHNGTYARLVDAFNQNEKEMLFLQKKKNYMIKQQGFYHIDTRQIAYWLGNETLSLFEGNKVSDFSNACYGFITGNNEKYLRLWHEVEIPKINFKSPDNEQFDKANAKYAPCNKGGSFRKWYGNNDYVAMWCNKDEFHRSGSTYQYAFFKEGLTWSVLSSNMFNCRFYGQGYVFDHAAASLFVTESDMIYYLMGYMNSKVFDFLLNAMNPTINSGAEIVSQIPIASSEELKHRITSFSYENVDLCRVDWDAFETSWDFKCHPLIMHAGLSPQQVQQEEKKGFQLLNGIEYAYKHWNSDCLARFNQLKFNEEEINRIFISIYGLQGELTSEVKGKDITVRKADLQRDIKSFISYSVGCMFGRYSLDTEGIIFAGGEWNEEKYRVFPIDKDNILPVCDDEYFEDDIVNRFVDFIRTVYGEQTLDENLKFIADALGGKGHPKDVIRNYFLNDFYADHLRIYQKRPIYWLFDSGKKNGFKCLIYMHRYQPDTIARIRTDYVHEQQSRYRTSIADLEKRVASASTSEKVKLSKQLSKLQDQAAELHEYEEKIHHLADQYISIDLDDGVKVNYAKFQDVLAKIK